MVFSVTCVDVTYPILRPLLGYTNINNFIISSHEIMVLSNHEVIYTYVIISRHA